MSQDDHNEAPSSEKYDPMGDQAAEDALMWLRKNADKAGKAKADLVYLENFRKVVLNRLKMNSLAKSDAAAETEARAHPEYLEACKALHEAQEIHEAMFWRRIAAEATLACWRTRSANHRGMEQMR